MVCSAIRQYCVIDEQDMVLTENNTVSVETEFADVILLLRRI